MKDTGNVICVKMSAKPKLSEGLLRGHWNHRQSNNLTKKKGKKKTEQNK